MCLMSRGNNVQRLDLVARICALYKNRVVLLFLCVLKPNFYASVYFIVSFSRKY